MMIPSSVESKLQFQEPLMKLLESRATSVILGYCESTGYAFQSRRKTPISLSEKLDSGRFAKWSELDDLYACTIIIPTLAEEASALAFLRDKFVEFQTKGRNLTYKDPAIFRYDATRFIAKVRPLPGEDSSAPLFQLLFEIQIRTAFEHAWSVTTHAVAYKGASIDWRSIRLAAQLKASVEQLDNQILGFTQSIQFIPESPWPEITLRRAIQLYLESEFDSGRIPSEHRPSNWTKFTESIVSVLRASSGRQLDKFKRDNEAFCACIRATIDVMNGPAFPRSISLFQFCLGALLRHGGITLPLHGYYATITQELIDLFPEASTITGFDFEAISI